MSDFPPPTFDTTRPHPARVRNYLLGGKDHFPVDREYADALTTIFPNIVDVAHASREFLVRAVTYLAADANVRQFLDIGPGLPVENSTHQIAQQVAPQSRIVYVDNDPLVLTHARALLVGAPEGVTASIDADLHEPKVILERAAETLDFTEPVGLILTAVMGLVVDLDEAYTITRTLLDALPSGSYLVLDDGAADPDNEQILNMQTLSDDYGYRYTYRTEQQIAGFFDGLDLVEPGIVTPTHWRHTPEPDSPAVPFEACGVGRRR
ncbi:SAM-dependent methyltransferase [Parafrankia sp. BMG5.11]|uniref:SAM-dependent methyltransferase n=1 Tax=Parafrankia sp. BMG5.11 TaxID=222540 RepID=UPI00103E095E|nr:SAM-dependent methyltransferase [Parafrankia sp. BMG5.11]TCJ34632.1 SAM-dependent methyltransferase [Parafrankia sp. BMG5.11]